VRVAAADHRDDPEVQSLLDAFDDRLDVDRRLAQALSSQDLRPVALRRRGHLDQVAISRLDEALERISDLAEISAAPGTPEAVMSLAQNCIDALQLYTELLDQDALRARPRRLGEPVTTRPLNEVALDRQTLLDAKRQLADALSALRSAR
jgi:hypothetical protein